MRDSSSPIWCAEVMLLGRLQERCGVVAMLMLVRVVAREYHDG